MVGATHDGRKELLAVVDGERESYLSWRHLLEDLKARGLTEDPSTVSYTHLTLPTICSV